MRVHGHMHGIQFSIVVFSLTFRIDHFVGYS